MLWFILFGEYHRLYLQSETAATSERQTESTPTTSQRLCCLTFTPPIPQVSEILHRSQSKRPSYESPSYLTAYVMRSGLRALIMHSLWREDLFFHSCGNFSFSGHSDSTNFFQRLAEPSMSRSRFLNSSMEHRDWWLEEEKWFRKQESLQIYTVFLCCRSAISDVH